MNFIKIIVIFLTFGLQVFGQNGIKEKKEQLKKLKTTFFNLELGLKDN